MIVELLGNSMDLTTLVFYALGLLPLIGMAESDDPPPKDKDDPPPDDKDMVKMSQNALNNLIDDRASKIRKSMSEEYQGKEDILKEEIAELTKKLEGNGDDDNKIDQTVIDTAVKKATV